MLALAVFSLGTLCVWQFCSGIQIAKSLISYNAGHIDKPVSGTLLFIQGICIIKAHL